MRRAPRRVADGDGMDRHAAAARPRPGASPAIARKQEKNTVMEYQQHREKQGNSHDHPARLIGNDRVISYNLNEGERPDGLKVRFKIRVETGKKAAARDAQLAKAVKELLQWSRQHRTPS